MIFTKKHLAKNLADASATTSFVTTATLHNNFTTSAGNVQSTSLYNEWLAALIWSSTLLAAGIYIVISLSVYEWRVLSKNKKIGKNSTTVKDRTDECTRWLCLAGSIFYLPRMIIEFAEVFEGQRSDTLCVFAHYAKTIALCGTVTCVYLVLWLRQRKIYNSPGLKHLSSKPVKFFSGSIIFLMATAILTTLSLYLFTRTYRATTIGCLLVHSTISSSFPVLLYAALSISFQIILVGLFIYPLYKHNTTTSLRGNNPQLKIIKKLLAATLIVVITTGFCGILSITVFRYDYNMLSDLIFETDSLVNLLSIIFSFNDWKARIFSFRAAEAKILGSVRKKTNQVDSHTASTVV